MNIIKNPVLKGFNPDPSILRVGNDYYIANSTFEWFPGVQIHHSKDLINWRLLTRPLNRVSQLDMKGNPDSCGIWAPCLSHDGHRFYLIYTDVKTFDGIWKDTHNYLVTANNIEDEWSGPVYLNSIGFDPSLFHDDDGKKWFVFLLVDHRKGILFGGIVLQEYDTRKQKLTGERKIIWKGTELGLTEGPHIYKKDGYYYLMCAEGGTEYGHAVVMARSKTIDGPYESCPNNPILTSRNNPGLDLQKTGHASIVETPDGQWYMAALTGRPLSRLGNCPLGRETILQEAEWKDDGWLSLRNGGNEPVTELKGPGLPEKRWPKTPERDDFDSPELSIHYQALRIPITGDWCTLKKRPGFLRLYGRESLCSLFNQSLIARRIQSFNVTVSVCMEFNPANFQQMAGLVFYYNTMHFYYLHVTYDEKQQSRVIQLLVNNNGHFSEIPGMPVNINTDGLIILKASMNREKLRFCYALDENSEVNIGETLDAGILSDDYVRKGGLHDRPAFTGAFTGICCQDLTGEKLHADFDWFEYREIED